MTTKKQFIEEVFTAIQRDQAPALDNVQIDWPKCKPITPRIFHIELTNGDCLVFLADDGPLSAEEEDLVTQLVADTHRGGGETLH